MHYSFGFMVWLRGLIKGNREFCGHNVYLYNPIIGDKGHYKSIVRINGVLHELSVRPIPLIDGDDTVTRAEIIANLGGQNDNQ